MAKVKIEYSEHALERMSEREVSKEYVEQAVRGPHSDVPAKNGRRHIYATLRGGKRLRVTYAKSGENKIFVFSVAWTERIN